jgi:hypothetical protein
MPLTTSVPIAAESTVAKVGSRTRGAIAGFLWRRVARVESVDGIAVEILAVDHDFIAARLRAAILLIKTYDPYRFGVLKRYLTGGVRVNFAAISAVAEFDSKICSCQMHSQYVSSDVTVEELASTLVHEATHARLANIGFKYESTQERLREEAVCLRQEIAFGIRLPNGKAILETAEWRLAHLDARDYDDASFGRRFIAHRLRLIRRLRKQGMPGWLLGGGGAVAKFLKRKRGLFHRSHPRDHAATESVRR